LRTISIVKLLTVFAVAFSLATLSGPLSGNFHLPTVPLGHAAIQNCQTHTISGACSEFWYPAGPAMNTELATIFTDETAEFNNLQSGSPSIDLTDWLLPNSLLGPITSSPNFLITAPQGSIGYYELEFHLGNSQWGCGFNFGNAACGVQIRQGIAHMIDKNSFTSNEAAIAGHAAAIDNALPTTIGGGLPSPNPCGYDVSFSQSGTQCVVGANGGTSYHLGASGTGADGFSWIQPPGSADLNAAAQHFVNAGVATGFNPTTSVLTGISAAAASNVPNLFIRNDNVPRFDLGNSLAAEICYLFTGAYTVPCTYLTTVQGPITAFPGFTTSKTTVNLNWSMYTAAFGGGTFYDSSLYFGYDSRFVSGVASIQSPAGPCDANSVPTASAGDYEYACDPAYDSLATSMETAPCQTAAGDPALGASSNLPTGPNNGICPGTTVLSSISAGIQAEAEFGSKVLTLPVFETTDQFGYLNNGWVRIANNSQFGISNFFTWLNAWNSAPVVPGTVRQGFKETTKSVNPYIASTVWDTFIMGNVFDSLYVADPLAPSQLINWMTISTFQESNSSLGYTAPAHTLTTYRFTLRPDLYFQDGTQVTSYDVAFSYLSLVGQGAFLGTGATSMTGVTVLQPHQFDISVNSLGPFTLASITGLPIVPGRYWTNAGSSSWDTARNACTGSVACAKSQYTLSGAAVNCALDCSHFPASLMTINSADTAATFDPISAHIFVGSAPWQCGAVTTSGSGTCSPGGIQNPGAGSSYTLTRFGAGVTNCQQSTCYFRSSSTLATYLWSEAGTFLAYTAVAACFGVAVNLAGSCGHFQQGIGNPGTGTQVGLNQVTIANRFYLLNWLAPFDWATNPPVGIGTLPPVLYEGPTTLNPASVAGCPNGYDC
jgi:hypothetical protein